jgi:hypothetical protein
MMSDPDRSTADAPSAAPVDASAAGKSPAPADAAKAANVAAASRAGAVTRVLARLGKRWDRFRVQRRRHGWLNAIGRSPTPVVFAALAGFSIVAGVGWGWSIHQRAESESAWERERELQREANANARTIAAVEASAAAVAAIRESVDDHGASGQARRLLIDQWSGQFRQLLEEAERRPQGTLAAEQARVALAQLEWRDRRRPDVAESLFADTIRRLTTLVVPADWAEDRDRLLETAFHGQFHSILEMRGGAPLEQCLAAWTEHLESTLAPYRGRPWAGQAWTRFSVARGLLAESRDTTDSGLAKRHYCAALASPPATVRTPATTLVPLPSAPAGSAWSASWLPATPVVVTTNSGDASPRAERWFFDEWLEDRAEVFARLARIEFLADDYPVAVALQRETVLAREELRRRAGTRRRRLRQLEESFTLGLFQKAAGEPSASRATLEATLAESERLVADFPDWREPRNVRRDSRESLAIVYRDAGEDARALALLIDATLPLAALPLAREPSAALEDQAIIREELGDAHAAAGRKSLAWRNAIESLELRDALWRRDPTDDAAWRRVLLAARATLERAVTPVEWRESLGEIDPFLERIEQAQPAIPAMSATLEDQGLLYLLRGRGLQLAYGGADANASLVARIRDSYTRARELCERSGKLTAERAREIDDRIRACDAVLKKLQAK